MGQELKLSRLKLAVKIIVVLWLLPPASFGAILGLENLVSYSAPGGSATWIREQRGNLILGTYKNSSNVQQAFIYDTQTLAFTNLNVGGTTWGEATGFAGDYVYFESGWRAQYRYHLSSGQIQSFKQHSGQSDAQIYGFDVLNPQRFGGGWNASDYPYKGTPYIFNGTAFRDLNIPSGYAQGGATGIYGSMISGFVRTALNYSPGVVRAVLWDESTGNPTLLNFPDEVAASDIYGNFVVGNNYVYDLTTGLYETISIPSATEVQILSIDESSGLLRVTGSYKDSSGVQRGFIGTIPEPSSLSLLLAGGAVLAAGRRRKRD